MVVRILFIAIGIILIVAGWLEGIQNYGVREALMFSSVGLGILVAAMIDPFKKYILNR